MSSHYGWISCVILLLKFSVAVIVHAETPVPWYSEADHYWHMNKINRYYLYDWSRPGLERWKAYVRGASEVTPSPSNLGVRLYGSYSWIDLGSHTNSCFVDIANCSNGFSVAFWVKTYKRGMQQTLLDFGGSNRGLSVIKTKKDFLETNLTSSKTGRTWNVVSTGKSLDPEAWHHVVITWNTTNGITLYLNATRIVNNRSMTALNQSSVSSSNWSMYVGKNKHAIAVDELVLWSHVVTNHTISKSFKFKTGIIATNAGCKSGWIANLQFCYRTFSILSSWNDAHRSCQKYSSNLMSIVSEGEDDFVNALMAGSSSCTHLGLTAREGAFYWTDDSVWGFSRLGGHDSNRVNDTAQCMYRNKTDSLWYRQDCDRKCGFVCKRQRAGIFRDADFYCRAKLLHKGVSGYRLSIVKVRSQLECAMECLIYGNDCQSYNYQKYSTLYPEEVAEHLCELNGSREHVHLVDMDGYQYCERR